MASHPSDHQASRHGTKTSVRWGLLAIALGIVGMFGWMLVNGGRAQQNLATLCSGEYARARTAADTTTIDRRVIVPAGRSGNGAVTCRKYRQSSK
jgi:hypothetical protein